MPKVTLCPLEELRSGEARRFDVAGHRIAVVRIDDDVYAIGDTCSHQNVSLSEGEVDTDELSLECWKLGSTFSLETGEALSSGQAGARLRRPSTATGSWWWWTMTGDGHVLEIRACRRGGQHRDPGAST